MDRLPSDAAGNWQASHGGSFPRQGVLLASTSTVLGSLVCEVAWGQGIPWYYLYPLYALAGAGIWATVAGSAIPYVSRTGGQWMWLSIWFLSAIAVERLAAMWDDGHMPFDRPAQLVLFAYIVAIGAGLLGLWAGRDRVQSGRFLRRIALLLAAASVPTYLVGPPPPGFRPTFPAPYIGFPVALFCLFAFTWYLNRVLTEPRVRIGDALGLTAASFPVLVAFHKPITFSALCSVVALAGLHWHCGQGIRSIRRLTGTVLIAAAALAAVDSAAGGEVYEHYHRMFLSKYIHSAHVLVDSSDRVGFVELAAGGRFDLWQSAMLRFWRSPIVGTGLGQREDWTHTGFAGTTHAIPIHNGFLDLLLSVGAFGVAPLGIGFWLFTRTALRRLREPESAWIVPVIAFAAGIGGYNLGGTSNLFIFLSAFVVFLMGLVVAPAPSSMRLEHPSNKGLAPPPWGGTGA